MLKLSYKLMIWSSLTCMRSKEAKKKKKIWDERRCWKTVRCRSWLISMCDLKTSHAEALWWVQCEDSDGVGGGAPSYLSGCHLPACLPGIQGWNPNSFCLQTRARWCSSSHRSPLSLSLLYYLFAQYTWRLIPYPTANTFLHLRQPTFQMSHCQVKYPLPLLSALAAQECMPALYFYE